MTIRVAPCDWPLLTTCCSAAWEAASPEQQAFASSVATEILWRLTSKRFGLCPTVVRPCRKTCASASGYGPLWGSASSFVPVLDGGQWLNTSCGKCRPGGCSCTELQEVLLPGPVDSITEVRVDGLVVPATAYQVHDHRLLVRTDGGEWPTCQDLTAGPEEAGAFTVTYQLGIPVPPGGQYAAGVYACELLAACVGGTCRLPKRVQTVTRQGVTLAFLDPGDYLKDGLTGVPEVDQWIRAVNPDQLRGRSRVYSPDLLPPRQITSP